MAMPKHEVDLLNAMAFNIAAHMLNLEAEARHAQDDIEGELLCLDASTNCRQLSAECMLMAL